MRGTDFRVSNTNFSNANFSNADLRRGLLVAIVVAAGYFIPNHYVLFPTHMVVLSPVDRWVPLSPVWIWVYIVYYPLLVIPYIASAGRPAQRVYVETVLLAAALGFMMFIFFPTAISRDLYPWMGEATLSSRLLAAIRGADNSVNCLPSMHVCMSFIATAALTRRGGLAVRASWWILFFAICYSTMATKQHYFADVIAGLTLGLTCTVLVLNRYGLLWGAQTPHPQATKSRIRDC